MDLALLDSGVLLYAGFLATAVAVNLATFAYFFHTSWLVQLVSRYSAYLQCGVEVKELKVGKTTFSYFDRNVPKVRREDGSLEEPETVVLFHGYTASKGPMARFAQWFPKSWRVVIPDLPAHGDTLHVPGESYTQDSMVELLHQFTLAIGLERFHLLGESMGGVIAAAYAVKHPKQLKTLSLICPPMEDAKRSKYFNTLEDTGRNVILPRNVTEFIEMLTLVYWQIPKVLPRRVLQALLDIQIPKYKGFEDVFQQMMLSRPLPQQLYDGLSTNITFPTLVLWGSGDKVSDISGGRILCDVIKGAELKVVEKCGHALTLERPRKTAQFVCNFIQKNGSQD